MPRFVPAAVGLFAALTAASAARYPGGSYCDPRARGVDLARNFFCDLHHRRAINGAPNTLGSLLGQLGAICLLAAVTRLWWRFPARGAVRALGCASSVGALLVPLTPSDVFGRWHTAAVVLAAGPGIAAVVLATRGAPAGVRALGAGFVLVGAAVLGLYVRDVALGVGCDPQLPLAQKLAALRFVAWVVALDAHRPAA